MLPILERLALSRLPESASILDLCSGTGRVSAMLMERGFRVTGVEGSAAMVRFARDNALGAQFLVADARDFQVDGQLDLAISVFESLNHIMSIEDLSRVFANVHRSLVPGGEFIFDLNREPAFEKYWNIDYVVTEADNVCACKTHYRAEDRIGQCDITMFRLEDGIWQRSDVTIYQKFHPVEEVSAALRRAGFADARTFDAQQDLGMTGDIGLARTFFQARR